MGAAGELYMSILPETVMVGAASHPASQLAIHAASQPFI